MRRIVLTLSMLLISHAAIAQIPQAKVTGGTVSGVLEGDLSVFKGIPFAAPPTGALRWRAPAPVAAWSGMKKTIAFADACMQPANSQGNTAPVNEDCLYLNVWTPAKSSNEKRPVIVWVHGGGYVGGSTSIPMYDGKGFAEKGVLFVSLAYRLGPYGFLAHPELSRESGKGSGAYGIQDLVVGLEWVRDNIAAFGGDPAKVTIFGHSAGAAAVSLLAASPLSKGLFHRVIAMSGASFAPLQTSEQTGMGLDMPALQLAEANGKEFLQKLGVADITAARKLGAEKIEAAAGAGMRFRPVADGHVVANDLYTLYLQGKFNDTPVLVGHASDETLSFGRGQALTAAAFEQQMKTQYGPHAQAFIDAYPHANDEAAARAARHVRNDSSFAWNSWAWQQQQSRHGSGKVYGYYYDHHAPDAEGSGHGSDVPYAFQTLATRRDQPSASDLKLSDLISTYWINFAASGNPNGSGLPEWPAFTPEQPQVMVFDAATGARPLPILQRLKVFDAYFAGIRDGKAVEK
jgi:para-nitrobenzyl esterase